jgi:hypothetical protein
MLVTNLLDHVLELECMTTLVVATTPSRLMQVFYPRHRTDGRGAISVKYFGILEVARLAALRLLLASTTQMVLTITLLFTIQILHDLRNGRAQILAKY